MDEAGPFGAQDRALLALGGMLKANGYRFVTPTPATHARVNARPGNEAAGSVADVFGWSRPFAPELLAADMLRLMGEAGVLTRDGTFWRSTVRASTLDGELFLHSAYPTSAADSVFFGPDTYRFAAAIGRALAAIAPGSVRRAVDVGCGAGPGAILVARACPAAEVVMVDINDEALRLAAVNAALAGTANAVGRRSDLLTGVEGDFDLVVSNPPYLNDPLRRAYRHGGGDFGAALSLAILDAALARLAPSGHLVLYTGVAIVNGQDPFKEAATERLNGRPVRWAYREVDPDVFGEELETRAYQASDRIAAVVLTAQREERDAGHPDAVDRRRRGGRR